MKKPELGKEKEALVCQIRLAWATAILEELCHSAGLKCTAGPGGVDGCTLVVLADEEGGRTLEVDVAYDILEDEERLEELRGIITMTRWPEVPHFRVRGFSLPPGMIRSYDWR